MKDSLSRQDLYSILAVALMSVLFFHRLLLVTPDRILAAFDMGHMQYFWAYFKKECFLDGILPLWSPYIFGGHPHAALPDAAVFYPPDVLYLALPLGPAMNVSLVMHQLAAGIFTYLYCREIKLQSTASLLGAIVFMLHGFFANQLMLGHIDIVRTACYLPAVLFFVERGLARKSLRSYLCGSVALALQILCGHPQMYFYTVLFIGLYVGLRMMLFGDLKDEGWRFFSPLLVVLSVVVLAVCLSIFQLLLTFEFSQLSDRASRSTDFAFLGSAHPVFFPQLFFPNLTIDHNPPKYESGGYAGILPLAAAVFALIGCRRKNRHVVLMGIAALLSLLLMFGGRAPLLHFIYYLVPGMNFFRIHMRIVLVFGFCVSVLSAIGIQELFSGASRRESPKAYWAALGIVVGAIIVLISMSAFWRDHLSRSDFMGWNTLQAVEEAVRWSDTPVLLPLLMLAVAGTGLYFMGRVRMSGKMQIIIVGVVWLDLFTASSGKIDTIPVERLTPQREFLQEVGAAEAPFRVWFPTEPYPSNRAIADHIENMNGYAPLMLARYMNFLAAATDISPAWEIKAMNHLRLEMFDTLPVAVARVFNVRFRLVPDMAAQRYRALENKQWTPRAYLVSNYQLAESEADSLEIVSREDFDPLESVILEEAPAFASVASEQSPLVPRVWTSINEVKVVYNAESPAMLVLSEQYYPGWKATVDDKPAKIYRANYLLRAVEAPAGTHTVRFVYRPAALTFGLPVSALALLGVLIAMIRPGRRRNAAARAGSAALPVE